MERSTSLVEERIKEGEAELRDILEEKDRVRGEPDGYFEKLSELARKTYLTITYREAAVRQVSPLVKTYAELATLRHRYSQPR